MVKSRLESERKNRIVRNKTVDRNEKSARTHTKTFMEVIKWTSLI
jgi:hypothetical protein